MRMQAQLVVLVVGLATVMGCSVKPVTFAPPPPDDAAVVIDASPIAIDASPIAIDASPIAIDASPAPAARCDDGTQNGDEPDVDCGGTCAPCAIGKRCDAPGDCVTEECASNVCVAASCSDGRRNSDETDVDCGGSQCAPCANGRACVVDRDCVGLCDGQCRPPSSCAELHQRRPAAGDGVYAIAPAGEPFNARCDMTRDGGGWTLLLKASSSLVFANAAAAWTDDSVLNVEDLTTNDGDAKYRSFLTLPITTLRGELNDFAFTKSFALQTALQVFAGPADFVEGFPTFNTGAQNWSAQPNCHRFGINLPFATRARFGWSANQEDNCDSNDTGIGLGTNGFGAGFHCGSTQCSAGTVTSGGRGLLWGR